MGGTRKEAAERAAEAAEAAAKKAEESTDVANKMVGGAAADMQVKHAAAERAAAEQARAAAEQAPDEDVRSNLLWDEAEQLTNEVADMQKVGPTGTWKGRSSKHNNPSSAKAWMDKAEGWKQAAIAWASVAAS